MGCETRILKIASVFNIIDNEAFFGSILESPHSAEELRGFTGEHRPKDDFYPTC